MWHLLADAAPSPGVVLAVAAIPSLGVLGLMFRIQKSLIRGQDRRIALCALENRECKLDLELRDWRQRKLETILRQNEIRFPDDYWDEAPAFITKQLEQIRKDKEELLK